jgi:nitroreductase
LHTSIAENRLGNQLSELVSKPAQTNAALNDLLRERWSPRIFDQAHTLSVAELESLGESFRWAPSSYNGQPWKLVFVTRGSELHTQISEQALGGFNGSWAPSASALAVVLGEVNNPKGEANNQAATAYDLGLASMKLTIQAESMGLKAHVMGGVDKPVIETILNSTNHFVMSVIAIGKQGSTEGQDEAIVTREQTPRERRTDAYLINQTLQG